MSNFEPLYFDLESEWSSHDKPLARVTLGAWAVGDSPVRIGTPTEVYNAVHHHKGPVVGHNLAFDLAHVSGDPTYLMWGSALGLPCGDIYDTHIRGILAQAANGEHADTGAGLKDLARKVGYPMPAKDKKITRTFGVIRSLSDLTATQRQYVTDDVEATRAIFLKQGGLARQADEERQTELSLHVYEMARRGVHIDAEYRQTLYTARRTAVEVAEAAVKGGGLIQPRGPKKDPWRDSAVDRNLVQGRLRASGATRLAESGKLLATDDTALRLSNDPALVALADLNDARKQLSLVEAWCFTDDDQGRQVPISGDIIRAWWKPLVASGRISCAWPNITQVPKKGGVREIVTARPGNKLVIIDFNALEARVWAATCKRWIGRSVMADKFWEESRGGEDVHTFVARHVQRLRPDLSVAECRQLLAKALTYGRIGLMGPRRAAATLGISETEADQLLRLWDSIFYEIDPYRGYMRRMVDGYPFLKVALPSSKRIRKAYASECFNYVIQGGGADVTKDALRLCQQDGLPVVALVHDELIIDVPAAGAEEAAQTALKRMTEAGQLHYPEVPWDRQKAEITDRWHSK